MTILNLTEPCYNLIKSVIKITLVMMKELSRCLINRKEVYKIIWAHVTEITSTLILESFIVIEKRSVWFERVGLVFC